MFEDIKTDKQSNNRIVDKPQLELGFMKNLTKQCKKHNVNNITTFRKPKIFFKPSEQLNLFSKNLSEGGC
jgi:hypothetical protein